MKTIVALFILLSFGCTRFSYYVEEGNIVKIKSSGSIALGQHDTIIVSFQGGPNSSSLPYKLKANKNGQTIVFQAYYKSPKNSDDGHFSFIPVHQLKYIFKPKEKGTYIYKGENTGITGSTIVH